MIEFKFDVLQEEIPDCYPLSVGDAVVPVASNRIAPGGYEYDTWQKLVLGDRITYGQQVDVRVDHRSKFMECCVDSETDNLYELRDKVIAVCEGIASHNGAN